jgi:hypothetical protein
MLPLVSAQVLRDPARLAGKPCAVVQYNPYGDLKSLGPDDDRLLCNSNGSLIAVSYEARAAGKGRLAGKQHCASCGPNSSAFRVRYCMLSLVQLIHARWPKLAIPPSTPRRRLSPRLTPHLIHEGEPASRRQLSALSPHILRQPAAGCGLHTVLCAGVKRNMRGDAARALCPELQLVQVPTAHGKADLTLYRDAGKRVLDILARCAKCERASSEYQPACQPSPACLQAILPAGRQLQPASEHVWERA